jgi:hypothetical protein
VRLAALSIHTRSSLGLDPTPSNRAATSLPAQKSQTSDRSSSANRMALGVQMRPPLGSPLQRAAANLSITGVTVRGSVSTKAFVRKLVAQTAEPNPNFLEAIERPNSTSASSEATTNGVDTRFASRETGDSATGNCRTGDSTGTGGLGVGTARQLTARRAGEHALRAVSEGAVEVAGTESENMGVEGDVLERVEKLRQVIADYSYRYHTLDNPVVR